MTAVRDTDMRIYVAKNYAVMSRKETATWGRGDSAADELSRDMRRKIEHYLLATGRAKCELYASRRHGGYTARVYHHPDIISASWLT